MPSESVKKEEGFPIEFIPNSDSLYMRIHKMWYRENELIPRVFKNHGNGMSTDWSKYSTPDQTKNRVKLDGKDPNNYGVINMKVEDVRNIESQIVEHTPIIVNRSHTDVMGEKTTRIRLLFLRIFTPGSSFQNQVTKLYHLKLFIHCRPRQGL